MSDAIQISCGPGVFRTLAPFVLGSGSPRRRELLASLGLAFAVCPSRAPEPAPLPGEFPEAYAQRMAGLKADDVAEIHPAEVVLGADTIVTIAANGENLILGKPQDADDALRMLALLSGRIHRVITGVCLRLPGGEKSGPQPPSIAVSTEVRMRESSRAELAAYVATHEPDDKAGAYAIQGLGAFLVERVNGSYTNVVGLPVTECAALLAGRNIIAPREKRAARN